jgi:hypothetical protein
MAQVCWMENGIIMVQKIIPDHSGAVSAHDLARALLEGPDLPVATHANNHTYSSLDGNLGKMQVRRIGEQIHIGNLGS